MTDKQKEAVGILFDLLRSKYVDEEEYYSLLDFVIKDAQPQVQYIQYYPWNTQQFTWDTEPHLYRVTCEHNATTTGNINK